MFVVRSEESIVMTNVCLGAARTFVTHFWFEWFVIMAGPASEKPKHNVIEIDFVKKVRKKAA
jgi:hypothetical protein